MSSHRALSSLDVVHLAQIESVADRLQWRDQIGELAFHLAQLLAQDLPIVDGFVLPTHQFIQHCQRAAIPETLDPDLPSLAQQCQAAIQRIPCADWLRPVQLRWERSTLSYPLVVLRPSFGAPLPIAAGDLLTPQIGTIDELPQMLKALWSEVFCARNLHYWPQYCENLAQIPLATLIQPLRTIEQSGRLWVTETTLTVERFWGVQWIGHPQEMDVPLTVIDRVTGAARSSGTNPQQLVHTVLGHWPRALPVTTPLIISGDQWLLPHPLPSNGGDRAALSVSPVTDPMVIDLAAALWAEFPLPLRVDWQYAHDQLQVQAIYLGEIAPLPQRAIDDGVGSGEVGSGEVGSGEVGSDGETLAIGLAASPGAGIGRAVVIKPHQALMHQLSPDSILVTSYLTPAWLPLMRQAAGLITEQGGMTSHAAVMARTLGIPAIVGVDQATSKIQSGDWLKFEDGRIQRLSSEMAVMIMAGLPTPVETVSNTGLMTGAMATVPTVPATIAPTTAPITTAPITTAPITTVLATVLGPKQFDCITPSASATQLLVAISEPAQITAETFRLRDGIGLIRGEYLLAAHLAGCSPWQPLKAVDRVRLSQVLQGALQPVWAVPDCPVWYRLADWRSHEISVATAVPIEANPALGMHGTWYYQRFPEWWNLELQTIAQFDPAVRSGLRLLLPFVRTADEVRHVVAAVQGMGLGDVPLWMMVEVPAIVYALPECAAAGIRGIAIGLNDLLQLLFGVDREQALMADFFDPSQPAVKLVLRSVLGPLIETARQLGLGCTVCSVPADAELIEFLVECGVTGIVVNPPDLDFAEMVLTQDRSAEIVPGVSEA